jgi:site-specific DNA-methyltransferase (adenine-specific)
MRKFSTQNADIYLGDCLDILKEIQASSIELIVTSPPYADQRSNTYGGIHPDKYIEWFLPRVKEFQRVLKPTGSFILNIKERVYNGERHTYVIELILEMKRQGWLWTEEYMWHKKNCYPGKWPNRFRDSWERLLHFTKQKQFKMIQDNVKIPMGNWANQRLKNLSGTDRIRDKSKVGSGFGKNISNWLDKDTVYPTNVLHLATECGNKNHSATFPEGLPSWFIQLFTEESDVVLDPFAGSGTTLVASNKLKRKGIGIDINQEYIDLMINRLKVYDR